MKWSPQQNQALSAIQKWLFDKKSKQTFYLAGFAGTGKSTLAKHIGENINGDVLYGAFTGKAALVLRNKGCDNASTIHSMIYRAEEDKEGRPIFKLNRSSNVRNAKIVIIDECSMVSNDLGSDLESFGTKILVLGDPAQLPPVSGAGYFTNNEPDFFLTEIHRQALDNPIIRLSMDVREGKKLQYGKYDESRIIRKSQIDADAILHTDQLIVGKNATRVKFNQNIREMQSKDMSNPVVGDKVICLKNNKELGLLNGGIWEIISPSILVKDHYKFKVETNDYGEQTQQNVRVHKDFFNGDESLIDWKIKKNSDEFTYAYAITCHKSQGSQWENVTVFDESFVFRDQAKRWLYTATTRASSRLTIVM